MTSVKKRVQALINGGDIADMPELLAYVAEQGWRITRRGRAYIGVQDQQGKRFRLFLEGHEKASTPGRGIGLAMEYDFWVYALLGHGQYRKACYIGQTRRVERRFVEHIKRQDATGGSSALFAWAVREGIALKVVLLEQVSGAQAVANRSEADWLASAIGAGYETPGMDVQERPASPGARHWPERLIHERCRVLEDVVARKLRALDFCI